MSQLIELSGLTVRNTFLKLQTDHFLRPMLLLFPFPKNSILELISLANAYFKHRALQVKPPI